MYVRSRAGRWYAFCYYYDRNGTRQRVRKSTGIHDDGTASSRKRAEIIGARIEQELALRPDSRDSKTIAQAFKARESKLILRNAPKNTIERVSFAAAHIFPTLGPDTRLSTLTAEDLERYARSSRAAKHSTATIERYLAELRAACRAVGEPCPPLPDLGAKTVRQRALTVEECRRLLAKLPPKRARCVLLVLQTGCRKNEVYHLARLAPGVGRIRRTAHEDQLKTGERTIPLTPIADAILAEGPVDRWVNAGRDLREAAERAGLGRVSWNDLRRTTATHLVLDGRSTAKVAALLGHTTTRMVEQVYARVASLRVDAEDLAALGQICVGPSSQTGPNAAESSPPDLEIPPT